MAVKKSGLGKGLDSLIKDNSSAKKTAEISQEKNSKKMHCWNWQTPLSNLVYFSRC